MISQPDDRKFAAADGGVVNLHDRFLRSQIERDQLVGLGDADDFRDTGQVFKTPPLDYALIAGNANGGSRRAGHWMGTKSDPLDNVHHRIDLMCGGAGFHHNQHMFTKPWVISFDAKTRSPFEREINQRPVEQRSLFIATLPAPPRRQAAFDLLRLSNKGGQRSLRNTITSILQMSTLRFRVDVPPHRTRKFCPLPLRAWSCASRRRTAGIRKGTHEGLRDDKKPHEI